MRGDNLCWKHRVYTKTTCPVHIVIPRQSVLLWTTDVHPVGEQRYKFVCTDNTINVKIAIDAETMSRYQSRITLQHIRTAIYWACSGRIFLQQN